jgi:hypothetical protein
MSFYRLSNRHNVVFVTLAVAAGMVDPAASTEAQESSTGAEETPAQAEETSTEADETSPADERTSYELRFTIMSPSARWSKVENAMLARHADRSLYYGPGIGFRVFIKQPHHGLLVDFDYKVDSDVDSLNLTSGWKTDFAIAHVGYAYRFIKHANQKMTWAFTPHASFSAGGTINRDQGPILGERFTSRGAAIGARFGVNVDLHIERFIMGWALEYEVLGHVRGAPLETSHVVRFTLIPIFRIGVDLGPKIQSLAH